MEILIKAKQTLNSQFNFLNYDDYLNPYYKHLVELIKSDKYVPNIDDEKSSDSNSDDDDDDDNYLHPLLSRNIITKTKLEITNNETIFKPNIKDSPYNELIEKFAVYSYVFLLFFLHWLIFIFLALDFSKIYFLCFFLKSKSTKSLR